MKPFVKAYPITSFLILNYLISWSFLYPSYQLILQNDEIPPLAWLGMIGAYGPSIAAVIIQMVIAPKELRRLLTRLIKIKARWSVWGIVTLLPLVLYAAAYLISSTYFSYSMDLQWKLGMTYVFFWIIVALPFGPMGEELGWRGFMLPRLLKNYSAIQSSFLVGLAWGVWHIASFTFPGAAIPDFLPVNLGTILLFLLNTMALSLVYTYVHLRTNGSVLMAIILHAFFNAAANIAYDFFTKSDEVSVLAGAYVVNILLAGAVGIVLVKVNRKNNEISI